MEHAFMHWCSSYYASIPDRSQITKESLTGRTIIDQIPTAFTIPPDEFEEMVEFSTVSRSGCVLQTSEQIRENNARRAFLDANLVLPHVAVVMLWCDQTVWISLWAVKYLQELLDEETAPCKKKRDVTFVQIQNSNHFVRIYMCIYIGLQFSNTNTIYSIIGTSLSRWFASSLQ
jgi:hypothetical protein